MKERVGSLIHGQLADGGDAITTASFTQRQVRVLGLAHRERSRERLREVERG